MEHVRFFDLTSTCLILNQQKCCGGVYQTDIRNGKRFKAKNFRVLCRNENVLRNVKAVLTQKLDASKRFSCESVRSAHKVNLVLGCTRVPGVSRKR